MNFDSIKVHAQHLANAAGCPEAAREFLENLIREDESQNLFVFRMQALALLITVCPEFHALLKHAVGLVQESVSLVSEGTETIQ